jgi:hypothetical protein
MGVETLPRPSLILIPTHMVISTMILEVTTAVAAIVEAVAAMVEAVEMPVVAAAEVTDMGVERPGHHAAVAINAPRGADR